MNERTKLPPRRASTVFDFRHGEINYQVGFASFDDGTVAEIFAHVTKETGVLSAIMRDAAVLASIALQYGAPLETLRSALTRQEDGIGPASPIGAVLDAVAKNSREA